MDRRDLYKTRSKSTKNTQDASRAMAVQRATNRDNLRSVRRNISPDILQPIIDPVPDAVARTKRKDRLIEYRAMKQLKKQQEAATKKKPFISVVKSGVFLDKTNHTEPIKKPRQPKTVTKKVKAQASSTTNGHVTSNDIGQSVPTSTVVLMPEIVQVETVTALLETLSHADDDASSQVVSYGTSSQAAVVNSNQTSVEESLVSTPMKHDQTELNSTFEVNPDEENIHAGTSGRILMENDQSQANTTFEIADNDDQETNVAAVNSGESSSGQTSQQTDEVMNQSSKTPFKTSLNTSLNYVSPFVTVSRGKRSAQKEEKVRESFYKLETSQPTHLSPIARQNREAAAYFRNQVDCETEKLMQTVSRWEQCKIESHQVDSVYLDQIDVAIGQTKLLITKKFNQFLNLINQCENGTGERPVLPKDLEGFWSMVYMQVDNCNERFKKLEILKSNNWIEADLTPVKVVKERKIKKVGKKSHGVSASSGIQKMIEEARQKFKENTTIASSNIIDNANFSMSLRQTPARLSLSTAVNTKTPKSIIKTPGIRRNTKSVAFAGADSPAEKKLPKLKAISTPKPRSIVRRATFTEVRTHRQNATEGNSSFSTPSSQRIPNETSTSSLRRSHRVRLFTSTDLPS